MTTALGTGPGTETRTVETFERSEEDFHKLMGQWAQEGWKVLSFSRRSTNPDGTMHRTVKLARANPAEVSPAQAKETRMVQTLEKSPEDFPKLMDQWRMEGWLVMSSSRLITNADGTMHRGVQLTKAKP